MTRGELTERMRHHLAAAIALRDRIAGDPARTERRGALRAWQATRLSRTYADLARSDQYRAATAFFLTDLYSTRDVSGRDREMLRALPAMIKLAPVAALEPLVLAFELDALTETVDAELADALPSAAIDTPTYASAYRSSADRPARERQVELLIAVGNALDRVAHGRLLGAAVTMMRAPAHAAGFGELQEFLERGLTAFRSMRSARTFLDTVRARELTILERLYAGSDSPFD